MRVPASERRDLRIAVKFPRTRSERDLEPLTRRYLAEVAPRFGLRPARHERANRRCRLAREL